MSESKVNAIILFVVLGILYVAWEAIVKPVMAGGLP